MQVNFEGLIAKKKVASKVYTTSKSTKRLSLGQLNQVIAVQTQANQN